jgi:glc operon protein GlcG
MKRFAFFCLAITLACPQIALGQPAQGPKPTTEQTTTKIILTSAGAQAIIAAAVRAANANGWGSSIAITDESGLLIAFHRTDGAPIGTIDVARRKAETAVKFQAPTAMLGGLVQKGGVAMLTLGDFVAVPGGYPIMADGQLIGAIGVSGGMSGEDDIIARAGLDARGSK